MSARAWTQFLAITLAIMIASFLLPGATNEAKALRSEQIVPGQLIVKLAPGIQIGDVNSRYDTRVQERFLDRKNTNIFLLQITDGSTAAEKLDQILEDPLHLQFVEYAELNYLTGAPEVDDGTSASARHRAFPADGATPTTKDYSGDASYPDSALKLTEALKVSKGNGTRVAIIDTGAQMNHPALKDSFVGVPRYDFVSGDRDPSEPPLAGTEEQRDKEVVGHGTHVAGIVHLVAPKAKLMPLRALDREGYGSSFHVAEAVTFAAINGADVINLSLGAPSRSRLLSEKVVEAINDGAVVVAAAGNYNTLLPQYPASTFIPAASKDDGLLAVTSVDSQEKKSSFANYGTWVDIAAPGEEILSTYPGSAYAYWSGTSMATPFVAGEAALVHAVNDRLGPGGIETRIRTGARCLNDENPTYLGMLGAGHADIGNTVKNREGRRCTVPGI